MTFIAAPTLADIRTATAVRLGFGPQAAQSEAQVQLLDEWIRRAARELTLEANWLSMRVRVPVALIQDQTIYDVPDGFEPGNIEQILVVDTQGREYPLEPGVRSYERDNLESSKATMPQRWEIVNQELRMYPKPDAERYPTFLVEGKITSPDPRSPDDIIPIDAEALIQTAVVIGKKHLGLADAMIADQDRLRYIARLRPTQSDGEAVQIGGHFSQKFLYSTRRGGAFNRSRYFFHTWTPRP